MPDTHAVTNQVPPLENYNPATSPVLTEALIREGGEWGLDEVTELGVLSGSRQAQRRGRVRPGVPRTDEGRGRPRPACCAVGGRPSWRAPRPRRQDLGVDP